MKGALAGAASRCPVRVFLVARSQLVAESLARALAAEQGIEQVGVVLFRDLSLQQLRSVAPEIVLIDSASHTTEAMEWTQEISDDLSSCKCLVIGAEAHQVVDFIENGAAGFTLRSDSLAQVGHTIRNVFHNRASCAPKITFQVISRLRHFAQQRGDRSERPTEALSTREQEVLDLLARGLRNKEIAGRLNIAAATARNHVQKIFGKLNVHRRADAVRLAFERGLVLEAIP